MYNISILDGYVDEPTCLGVPPYISPYPRYIYGGIKKHNMKNNVFYNTIDDIRKNPKIISEIINKTDLVVFISGVSVPGRYLSGYPLGPSEIVKLLERIKKPKTVLAGPAAKTGFSLGGGRKTKDVSDYFDITITGDAEIVITKLLENNLKNIDIDEKRKNESDIRKQAIIGSEIVKQHPFYPDYVIAEIETYRGCPRSICGGCSFCSEPLKGLPDFRPIKDIVDEIKKLYDYGIRHIRLGNQPCIFSYMSKEAGEKEIPRPNPEALEELFSKIRRIAPDLKTFHIDNANPGVIAKYPEESERIVKTIIKYHTSGDVAAMGIESADPTVIKKNNLKASPEESFEAIKIINKNGKKRGDNGLSHLLPGLNLLFGLDGETKKTFEYNYDFLKQILDMDLLVRRINIRQVIPIKNTKLYEIGTKNIIKHKKHFKKFKQKINNDIQRPMLERVIPKNTVLKNVFCEKHDGNITFARQIGSYPILVGIPGKLELNKWVDVKIFDYGYRSITGIPYPLDINTASRKTIEAIPGIGKKRAIRILRSRPIKNYKDLKESLDSDEIAEDIRKYLAL